MIDLERDFSGIFVHCRFAEPTQLVHVLRFRLWDFVQYVEDKAARSGNSVLWTDQKGGIVKNAKFDLKKKECENLADKVKENQEFDFLAWTSWNNNHYPSISFTRRQMLGDKSHINYKFPPYYLCYGDDIWKFINRLIGFDENDDVGFYVQIGIRIENSNSKFAFQEFNIFYDSKHGKFDFLGIKNLPNGDLPEGVYAEPMALAEKWIPKLRNPI